MEPEESENNENPHENHEEYPLPEVTVNKRKSFRFRITIEPIVFGVFLADSLSDTVTQSFILQRTCINHFHYNQSLCSELAHPKHNISDLEEKIQPYSAVILTGMNFLSKFFPAIFSLFVGPWSDYNGRKLILVLPALGYSLQYLVMISLIFFPKLGPEYGFLAVIPVALTGGFTNFITGVYSYISDISKEDDRSFRMSLIEAVILLSVYIGLVSSSFVLEAGGHAGYILVYGLSALFVLITTIPTYFFVPESVQTTEMGRGLLKIFDVKLISEMFQACCKKRENNKRAVIFLVSAVLTIIIGVGTGEANVLYLYTKLRFGWDIRDFTIWASVILACSCIGLIFMSMVFTKCLKISDPAVAVISIVSRSIGAFLMAFTPSSSPNLMYYNGLFTIFYGLCCPVERAILSKSIPKEDLGKVFALLGAAEAIFPLAMGPLFTILYNSTIHTAPNAFLFVSGGFFVLCIVFCVIVYFLDKQGTKPEHERLHDESTDS